GRRSCTIEYGLANSGCINSKEATLQTRTVQLSRKWQPNQGIAGWAWFVFLVVLVAELIGAYYIVYKGGFVMNDAIARTANAYYVLYILPNKLASIGFVWNPLPSLLQLPILIFNNLWRPLATNGMAGSILTAIFAAINASLLFRYFRTWGSGVFFALLVAFLYAFNPFFFFYGLNGMSETLFFTAVIIGVYHFAIWMEDRNNSRLLWVALTMAMGFLTRYEILTLMLGFASSLLVVIYLMEDKQSPFKKKPVSMKFNYTIATFLVTFLPVAYVIGIWIAVCWTIMGDPFFFLSSAYSNESQAATALSKQDMELTSSIDAPINAFIYMSIRLLPFVIPCFVVLIERILTWRLFKLDIVVFILLVGSFLGFHYVLLLTGKSFGWLRFFCYAMPVCLAWFPYELMKLRKWARRFTAVGLCIGLAVSSAILPVYFSNWELASEEYPMFHRSSDGGYVPQMELAKIINEKYSDKSILMDSFTTSSMIVNLDHPENIITTTSDNFFDTVKNPQGYGVDYIVVSVPRGLGLLDAVNIEYPDLFYYGVPFWAELAESSEWFRIYRVMPWSELIAEEEAEQAAAEAIDNTENAETGDGEDHRIGENKAAPEDGTETE
ncbi:MAG: glycosyltransferase family 39 protein, partial [Planctomycetes bacterium]|nr:glycosyltransferase family 39 protein [Planctomycetota bacterium]